jgi:hypothetical protein
MVLGDFWIEELTAQRFEAFERALLIRYFRENRLGLIAG